MLTPHLIAQSSALTESLEEYSRYPYVDAISKKLHIGFGINIEDTGITREEAVYLMMSRLRNAAAEMQNVYPFVTQFDEVRQLILIRLWYQMGCVKISKFGDMWAYLEKNDFQGAAREMRDSLWYQQMGGINGKGEPICQSMEMNSAKPLSVFVKGERKKDFG